MKVQDKAATTYVEVADELVRDFAAEQEPTDDLVLQKKRASEAKNVRRRVYDALNVLKAMDIISNENKQIRWKGLPSTTSNQVTRMETEKVNLQKTIRKKKLNLEASVVKVRCVANRHCACGGACVSHATVFSLVRARSLSLRQHVAMAQLVKRNERARAERQVQSGGGAAAAAAAADDGSAAAVAAGKEGVDQTVAIPFIVLSAPADAEVVIEASHDQGDDQMREMSFIFKTPYDIYDDPEVRCARGALSLPPAPACLAPHRPSIFPLSIDLTTHPHPPLSLSRSRSLSLSFSRIAARTPSKRPRKILKQLDLTRATQAFLDETLPSDLLEFFPTKSIVAGEEGGAAAS
jgi:hypothetical protein